MAGVCGRTETKEGIKIVYPLKCWMKPSGLPVLSRKQIDQLGEEILRDFAPDLLKRPGALDIDLFVESYLGMELDFQYLSNNGIYLGMTIFDETSKLPVYDPEKQQAKYFFVKGNTVLIDRSLIRSRKNEGRYRFTVGHEAAHALLHREYYRRMKNYLQEHPDAKSSHLPPCRAGAYLKPEQRNFQTDHDWLEWQADTLASALLMPKSMVSQEVYDFESYDWSDRFCVDHLAEVFQVSRAAVKCRVKQLNLHPGFSEVPEAWDEPTRQKAEEKAKREARLKGISRFCSKYGYGDGSLVRAYLGDYYY